MRTTVTLDDDLAARLKEAAYRSGRSFKVTINEVLRAGLDVQEGVEKPRPYVVEPRDLGGPHADIDLDKALGLADSLEDEGIVRKLELRK
ncbi:MAG: ribbon-helix-helix domain-containing protein [Holophagales bacterium]|nr:ribbon-helix-helix domain-containing protein [Holophagales bacterium]